jgi:hypothetical protein
VDQDSVFYRQAQLLVQSLPYVASEDCFALKGGTAINLFYLPMPRLSVDIDLVYIPIEDRETSLNKAKEALQRITKYMASTSPRHDGQLMEGRDDQLRIIVRGLDVQIKIEVTPVKSLEAARIDLANTISRSMTEQDKEFLMSVKQCKPDWTLLPIEGIDQLPAVRWKLINLERMPRARHIAAAEKLARVLKTI